MNRRSSLKILLIISASGALLPSCLQDEKKTFVSLKNIKINGKDEELLLDLSETIIPKTNTQGAKDVSAHLFALIMIDDCYAPADQDRFVKGLKGFEDYSKKKFDKSFSKSSASEREEILKSIESRKDVPENVAFFYYLMKRLTIQAFISSKYYLTKVQVYQLVPGKFYGCVPVKKAS